MRFDQVFVVMSHSLTGAVLTWYSAGHGVESELPGAVRAHHRVGQRHEVLRRPEAVLQLVLGEGLVLLLQLGDSTML